MANFPLNHYLPIEIRAVFPFKKRDVQRSAAGLVPRGRCGEGICEFPGSFKTHGGLIDFKGHPKDMAVCQNPVPLVNIKIACKWMFIPLKIVLIGIDPYPYSKLARR